MQRCSSREVPTRTLRARYFKRESERKRHRERTRYLKREGGSEREILQQRKREKERPTEEEGIHGGRESQWERYFGADNGWQYLLLLKERYHDAWYQPHTDGLGDIQTRLYLLTRISTIRPLVFDYC